MPKKFERFIGVYEIEAYPDGRFYLYFTIPGIDGTKRLKNPSLPTLARLLRFNDIRPINPIDGQFMAKYIYDAVMRMPRKKLLSK